jgi:hypothetical protein
MADQDNTQDFESDAEEFELDLAILSDVELARFESMLVENYAEIRNSDEFSASDSEAVEELTSIRDAIMSVRDEMTARMELAAADDEIGKSVADKFAAAMTEFSEEEVAEEVAEEAAPAAVEPSNITIAPKGLEGDVPAVAASAERKPLARIAADVRGFRAGQDADTWNTVAQALINRHPDTRSADSTGARFLVASIEAEYPADRILGDDAIANTKIVEAVTGQDAVVASGGLCAMLTPWYNLQTYGDSCRPLRDAFPSFKADRGGIRFVNPPKLSDLAGSARRTTAAEDAAGYTTQVPAGPTAPKPCLHVTCGQEQTCIVQAATSCLTFGNFGARTYPEQVEAWLKLARVEFARYQEQELLTALHTGSTAVTAVQTYGATFSILEQLGFIIDGFKNRYRICGGVKLRLVLPFWVKSILANDIAAQAPGDGLGRYTISDAQVNSWLENRGYSVVWTQDTLSTDPFPVFPAAGVLGSYPTTFKAAVYPEGEWVYLENGVVDLGLVRDSQLNSVNDYQIWMEEFNGLCRVGGIESLSVEFDLCANGVYAPADVARVCA